MTAQPHSAAERRIETIVPAAGWWLTRLVHCDDGSRRTDRVPVAAWAVIDDTEDGQPYRSIEALVAGDGGWLVPASNEYPDPGGWLEHADEIARCECAASPQRNGGRYCDRCGGRVEDQPA